MDPNVEKYCFIDSTVSSGGILEIKIIRPLLSSNSGGLGTTGEEDEGARTTRSGSTKRTTPLITTCSELSTKYCEDFRGEEEEEGRGRPRLEPLDRKDMSNERMNLSREAEVLGVR